MSTITNISVGEFREYLNNPQYCVIDVRDHAEHAAGSETPLCLPVSTINADTASAFMQQHNVRPDKTLVLLCARGMRATQAAERLRPLVPNPIAIVEGGRAALAAATGEKQPVSIERQVRIAAGSLVLLGIIASVLIHPAAIVLSVFVASGLIFAGITDWCGLGLLMMKMPWNRMTRISG
jgi:rhodanese-related sulfurtransferase